MFEAKGMIEYARYSREQNLCLKQKVWLNMRVIVESKIYVWSKSIIGFTRCRV